MWSGKGRPGMTAAAAVQKKGRDAKQIDNGGARAKGVSGDGPVQATHAGRPGRWARCQRPSHAAARGDGQPLGGGVRDAHHRAHGSSRLQRGRVACSIPRGTGCEQQ